jgi:nucleoside-diphosphate-sugar epimerase
MAQALLAASGRDAVVRADAAPADSPDSARSADIPWQQADITRAAEDLGWSPRRDLATSLADLWKASA